MIPALELLAFSLGPSEMLVILVVGLLVFGRRLPEVGKQFGKTFLEFRKGLHSFRQDIELDEDVRETRSTMRELQREITRPVEIEPWTRDRTPELPAPETQLEPANEDLDHGPLADRGGAHALESQDDHESHAIAAATMIDEGAPLERAEDEPRPASEFATDAPAAAEPRADGDAPHAASETREA
jgi:sec-independent protein translocase protein TatA